MTQQLGGAIITGGAMRIGKELSLTLGLLGYHVIIHYQSSDQAARTLSEQIKEAGGKADTLQADLTNRRAVYDLFPRARALAGPISLLVNSASIFESDEIGNITDDIWDKHMAIHVHTPIMLSQAFAEQIDKVQNNMILNIIDQSIWALTPKFFSYTISKSALWTATQTLAQSLAPQKIRVNAIGPGPTLKNKRQSDSDWEEQNAKTILGYGASPTDIAETMKYLISAKAVTGQMIAVDGGQHLAWETPDVQVDE